MQKIAILTDSGCDLDQESLEKYNINLVPFRIIYKDREYLDRLEISPDEVYSKLIEEVPTTSLPSMQFVEDLLNKLETEGYTHMIFISISSGLSGTYNSIRLICENHTNLKSYVHDSKTLCMAQGFEALNCAKMVEEGKSFEEIIFFLKNLTRPGCFFTIDTLEYLKKGGRIGKVSGTIGELLNIKPLIAVNEDGIYYTLAKARGRKQIINKLKELLMEFLEKGKYKICIMQGNCMEDAIKFKEFADSLPNLVEANIKEVGPALGVHTGPGVFGFCIEEVK